MPRDVNLTISDVQAVGTNVSVPRYRITLDVNYLDNQGARKTRSRTVTFPDDLNLLSVRARNALLRELMLNAARVGWGLLSEDDL